MAFDEPPSPIYMADHLDSLGYSDHFVADLDNARLITKPPTVAETKYGRGYVESKRRSRQHDAIWMLGLENHKTARRSAGPPGCLLSPPARFRASSATLAGSPEVQSPEAGPAGLHKSPAMEEPVCLTLSKDSSTYQRTDGEAGDAPRSRRELVDKVCKFCWAQSMMVCISLAAMLIVGSLLAFGIRVAKEPRQQ